MRRLLIVWTLLTFLAGCQSTDPNDPATIEAANEARNLGLAFLEENRLDEAEAEFLKLQNLLPGDASGFANHGVVHLRRGDFEEARAILEEALERAPDDPTIALSLVDALLALEETNGALSLLEEQRASYPDDVPTQYKYATLLDQIEASEADRVASFREVVRLAPANLVPNLMYLESLVQAGEADSALFQMEHIRQLLPELPRESLPHFEETRLALQEGDTDRALNPMARFHNLMKITPLYQTGIRLLGNRTDAVIGIPVISEPPALTQSAYLQSRENSDILESLRFVEAASNAQISNLVPAASGTPTPLALADFNGDGEYDLLTVSPDAEGTHRLQLLVNSFGSYALQEETLNIAITDMVRQIALGDYNNDTHLDFYLVSQGPNRLFTGNGAGQFEEQGNTGTESPSDDNRAVFFDYDHDGDLDLFVGSTGEDKLYRNNGDGRFVELASEAGLTGEQAATVEAHIGDFDDDGDIDLFVVRADAPPTLFSNTRQGRFMAESPDAGWPAQISRATVGDPDNDGILDIILVTSNTLYKAYFNGEDALEVTALPVDDAASLPAAITALTLFDFDNDGYQDLFLSADQSAMLHNRYPDGFALLPDLFDSRLPESHTSPTVVDYNLDRDLDLFLPLQNGGIELWRNDGGHLNKSLSIQTRGLLTNNSKNNYYSIGGKIEVRAGDLYQVRVITQPVTHIGIGQRLKADVIRITFTNGVPQNIFQPGSDQDIIEQQVLKGSCPFLYTWNGDNYVFATDILWRSALGMPLGILGGETSYAPASPARDFIKIPGGLLAEDQGLYRLKVTAELWETPYFDEIKLLAIDHPVDEIVQVNEVFGPPPEAPPVFRVIDTYPVTRALNERGMDVTPLIIAEDSQHVATFSLGQFQGIAERHSLILEADNMQPDRVNALYLKGWIFPTDASINVAMSQSEQFQVQPPEVQVINAAGQWETIIPNMGFPMGKNKTVRVDLAVHINPEDPRVRINTNLQIYWDYAYFAEDMPGRDLSIAPLSPETAQLQYRGFSRAYRTSPYGPHLFDHEHTSLEPRWNDLHGFYTRYGDVAELLQQTDDRYVIMNAGDAIELTFDAGKLPRLPDGYARTMVLYSDGWLKDGDLNTAYGQTVEPLPFQGMPSYPYEETVSYPQDSLRNAFRKTYLTREVGPGRHRLFSGASDTENANP